MRKRRQVTCIHELVISKQKELLGYGPWPAFSYIFSKYNKSRPLLKDKIACQMTKQVRGLK